VDNPKPAAGHTTVAHDSVEALQQKLATLESELAAVRAQPKKIPMGELHMRMQAAEARVQELEAAALNRRPGQVHARGPGSPSPPSPQWGWAATLATTDSANWLRT
jgi:hypothetical protein